MSRSNQFVSTEDVTVVRWDRNKDVHKFMANQAGKSPEILEYLNVTNQILDRFKKSVLDLEIQGDLDQNLQFIKQAERLLEKGFVLTYHNW